MSSNGQADSREWIQNALERYEGALTRYALRLVGDVDKARDIVQETFLRLCRQTPSQIDGHLSAWLFTVCRNNAIDARRREQRMTSLTHAEPIETESHEPAPVLIAEQHDESDRILELVNRLPANQQEVIRLRFQNSLSYREIADVTGLTVTNVGFLIHRGLKTVRGQLVPTHE